MRRRGGNGPLHSDKLDGVRDQVKSLSQRARKFRRHFLSYLIYKHTQTDRQTVSTEQSPRLSEIMITNQKGTH